MARYGMVINCEKCVGCYNCFLSCQDEFCGNAYEGYSAAAPAEGHNWMRVIDKERGAFPKVKVAYIPKTCMHCEKAKCIEAAQDNAVYRRSDRIVIIDPLRAVGQRQLVAACPYRVIEWNEEKQVPQKCNLCAHLLDRGGKEPRCVEACPTGALIFGDLDDKQSTISHVMNQTATESLCPEFNLEENVVYTGLPKRFVSGTVVYKDKNQCAENVEIELSDKTETRTTKTNGFGDFEFEGLEASKSFSLKIRPPGYKEKVIRCNTSKDIHLGDIYLISET